MHENLEKARLSLLPFHPKEIDPTAKSTDRKQKALLPRLSGGHCKGIDYEVQRMVRPLFQNPPESLFLKVPHYYNSSPSSPFFLFFSKFLTTQTLPTPLPPLSSSFS